jgi:hypothetical protein
VNDEHISLADVRLSVGEITQYVAAQLLSLTGSDVDAPRDEVTRRLVRELDKDARIAFTALLISDLMRVVENLTGSPAIYELAQAGSDLPSPLNSSLPEELPVAVADRTELISVNTGDPTTQRETLRSWLIYLAPMVATSNPGFTGSRLHPVKVMLALAALEWGEVLPIFQPRDSEHVRHLQQELANAGHALSTRQGLPKNAFTIAVEQCKAIAWSDALIQAGAKPGAVHAEIVSNFQIHSWDAARKWQKSFLPIVGEEHFVLERDSYFREASADLNSAMLSFQLAMATAGRRFAVAKGWKPKDKW